MNNKTKELIILIGILIFTCSASAQEKPHEVPPAHFGGSVTATNNGISFIPYISLGKPAVIFDMFAGKRKISFEPQFRFAMEGKPWAFVFWWRYILLNSSRLQVNVGAHPSVIFKTIQVSENGVNKEIISAHQYLAGEISPSYTLFKNISAGPYFFYSRGLDREIARNTNMVALRFNFSEIRLTKQYYLKFNPQFYYLRIDDKNGTYFSETLSLLKRNFPLSVSSVINNSIRTDIPSKSNFLWNISLIYTFNKEYFEK